MTTQKKFRRGVSRARSTSIYSEDFFSNSRQEVFNKKTKQLCAQVRTAIGLALSCDFEDPCLQDLYVQDVVPFPDASRLLVITVASEDQDRAETLRRLQNVSKHLRAAVALRIHRKKVPSLSFDLVAPGGDHEK